MKRQIFVMGALVGMIAIHAASMPKEEITREKLGELLFFDTILSQDKTVSCASCHKPAFAFADSLALSIGINNKKGSRNTPAAMNLRLAKSFFWDGRAATLEEQALAPISNPDEMGLPITEAVKRLQENERYRNMFLQVFKSPPNESTLALAIAAYERTLETSNSAFDNWKFNDDSNAVSVAVKRGFTIFNEKGKCVHCHFGSDFTTNEFRNIGLFDGTKLNDSGRYTVTKKPSDIGRFKTPSLRNIAVTAPYMHNGMFKSLEEVIEFYNDTKKVVPRRVNIDTLLDKPLGLTKMERQDLKAFLLALTDSQFISHAKKKNAKRTKTKRKPVVAKVNHPVMMIV